MLEVLGMLFLLDLSVHAVPIGSEGCASIFKLESYSIFFLLTLLGCRREEWEFGSQCHLNEFHRRSFTIYF
jgi:hypothetical protein